MWLIVGFILLIKGADYFVDSASTIARKLHVSPLIVGLTIVAFGTSAPEAVVSIIAALDGNGDLVVGNIVGSNIVNITLLLGVTVLVSPIIMDRDTVNKDVVISIFTAVLLFILAGGFWTYGDHIVGRADGVVILLFFAVFLIYVFMKALRSRGATMDKEAAAADIENDKPWWQLIVILILGLAAIIFGGDLVVNSATEIAIALGMSQALVGLTIVAIGTSLPELVTSVAAARKGQASMAVGNLIGSNIFNIFFVTGLSAVIMPLLVVPSLMIDAVILIVISVIVYILSRTGYKLGRVEGTFLILIYIVYLVYIILRG
ncbi:calcium/sodium antiporter [Corticicoccus populi]|uniref:Calcium/sodium antiporter n=1 Tax=Corticicoccus populi TaxID=1812821 RepID=A0ABW5WXE7_9STAP